MNNNELKKKIFDGQILIPSYELKVTKNSQSIIEKSPSLFKIELLLYVLIMIKPVVMLGIVTYETIKRKLEVGNKNRISENKDIIYDTYKSKTEYMGREYSIASGSTTPLE